MRKFVLFLAMILTGCGSSLSEDKERVYNDGHHSGLLGQPPTANPYDSRTSTLYISWAKGWAAGDEERRKLEKEQKR